MAKRIHTADELDHGVAADDTASVARKSTVERMLDVVIFEAIDD